MNRHLTDEDIDALCTRLIEVSGFTAAEHKDHHVAFAEYIASQRRKAETYQKIKEQVGGWMVITVLATIGLVSWHGFLWFLNKGH